jgi:hypothetical protein
MAPMHNMRHCCSWLYIYEKAAWLLAERAQIVKFTDTRDDGSGPTPPIPKGQDTPASAYRWTHPQRVKRSLDNGEKVKIAAIDPDSA